MWVVCTEPVLWNQSADTLVKVPHGHPSVLFIPRQPSLLIVAGQRLMVKVEMGVEPD